MKKLIIILTVLLFAFTSCDTTDPKPPEEKPPGYQEDISWPSLADSPWPMFRGNAQYTGRSKYYGPSSGNVDWYFDSVYIGTGAVIGPDNSVIFQTGLNKSRLYKLTSSGNMEWFYPINEIASGATPLILVDTTIVVSTYTGGKIVALNNAGEEKWIYDTGNYITTKGMNIGIDGTIYFVDSTQTLFALNKNGNLVWKIKLESSSFGNFYSSTLAFSSDGNTLYVTGHLSSIYAVNIRQQAIKWSYGDPNWIISSPLVDFHGNIYLYGTPAEFAGLLKIIKLNRDGKVDWEYSTPNNNFSFLFEPTMDYNGNIYFGGGTDTLYSIDYSGNLRWKVDFGEEFSASISSPLLCDGQNHIYFSILKYYGTEQFKILSIGDDGKLIWQTQWLEGRTSDSPALGAGCLYYPVYRRNRIYAIK